MSLFCNFDEAPALIKDRLVLSSVIEEEGIQLKKQGREWVGLCPFHDEKTPSFSVNDSKGVYFCRGCRANGDVISFIADRTGQNKGRVIRSLAKRVGYSVRASEGWSPTPKASQPAINTDDREALTAIHDHVAQIAHANLVRLLESGKDAALSNYLLSERQFSHSTIIEYGLGYLPAGADLYELAARKTSINNEPTQLSQQHWETLAAEAGLLRLGKHRSMFQGRLLFPVINPDGLCVAFSARVIPEKEGEAVLADRKYLNSPATLIFDKSRTLFGMTPWHAVLTNKQASLAWRDRLDGSMALLVEGLTDVMRLGESGVHAFGSMGTSITENHLRMVFRQFDMLKTITDGDNAGVDAAKRTLLAGIPLLKPGKRLSALVLPEGEDPDTYFKAMGTQPDVVAALAQLPEICPEEIWFAKYIRPVSDPLTLADQVTIEHALSGGGGAPIPDDPTWRLAFHRYVADQTGYVTRPYHLNRGTGLVDTLNHTLIEGDVSSFWAYRVARFPALLGALGEWENRWWVQDALNGLLADPVECPPALRLLYHAKRALARSDKDPAALHSWPQLADALIDSGFPSSLLVHWSEIAYDTDKTLEHLGYAEEVYAPDLWEYELQAWVGDVDRRLTEKLRQAVIAD